MNINKEKLIKQLKKNKSIAQLSKELNVSYMSLWKIVNQDDQLRLICKRNKMVIDDKGRVYSSVEECASEIGYERSTLYKTLEGKYNNPSVKIKWLNEQKRSKRND